MFESRGIYYKEITGGLSACGLSEDWDREVLSLEETINGVPVIQISAYAFANVSSLIKVLIPHSIQKIGPFAFADCCNLTRIMFHRSKNSSPVIISEQAFRNCVSLKQVRGSALLRLNDGYEFLGCKSMKQTPAGICGEIKKGAFQDCSSLELLNFHYVTKIDDDAFDKNNHIAAVYVGRDFECSETFLESIKNARIICYKESKFVDLVYDGYHIVV